jgi:hypothetical protein
MNEEAVGSGVCTTTTMDQAAYAREWLNQLQ